MSKLNYIIVSVIFLSINISVFAQGVAINNDGTSADTSAMLDVKSTNSGLLIPRVALIAKNAASPITSPTTSLLVYNTATVGSSPNNVTPGYYFWDGSAWIAFMGDGGEDWSLTGNTGTTAGTNFIGTTDDIDLVFKVNDSEAMRVISDEGYLGINKAVPTTLLDVLSDETGDKIAANFVADADGSSAVVGVLGQALDGDGTDASYGVMGFAEEGSARSAGVIGVQSDDTSPDWTNYKFDINGLGMASGISGYTEGSYLISNVAAGAFKNVALSGGSNYGIVVENEATGIRTGVGVYTSGATAGTQYGIKGDVSGGSATNYGYYNEVTGTGSSDSWGEYIEMEGGNDLIGIEHDLDNFSATARGIKTVIDDGTDIWGIDLDIGTGGGNSGTTRGIDIDAGSSSGSGDTYGLAVSATAKTGVNKAYGIYSVGSAGPLETYGVFGQANQTTGGAAYGVKGYVFGTSTSKESYAIYGETDVAGHSSDAYAGYFKTGKVYVDYRLGIGDTDPLGALTIGGVSQHILMNSTLSNMIKFNDQGSGPPIETEATGRSNGTKIILNPTFNDEGPFITDYAIGVDANTLWFGTDESAGTYFKWYGGIDEKMRLVNGNLSTSGTKIGVGELSTTADKNTYIDIFSAAAGALSSRLIRWSGTNGILDLRNDGTGFMRFQTNGTNTRMAISGTGNVGIGNTSDVHRLDVTGDIRMSGVRSKLYFQGDNSTIHGGGLALHATGSGANIYMIPIDPATGAYLTPATIFMGATGAFANATTHLNVNGNVTATAFIATTVGAGAFMYNTSSNMTVPDYVFEKYYNGSSQTNPIYKMNSLYEVEKYIKTNHHLPRVPSRKEVLEDGVVNIQGLQMITLEKVEELFIYTIKQQKLIEALEKQNKNLENRIEQLENQ